MKRDCTPTVTRRFFQALVLLQVTACASMSAHSSEPGTDPNEAASSHWARWVASQDAFPVGAWVLSYSAESLPDEIPKRYIDAGFTLVPTSFGSAFLSSQASIVPAMTWDRGANVTQKDVFSRSAEIPDKYSNGVAFLGQELEPGSFDAIGSTQQAIYLSTRPRVILPLGSLFPNWYMYFRRYNMTYDRYVEHYINRAHPAALMTTHFPLLGNGTDRIWFYDNLETLRRQSLGAGIGLIGQVQCVGHGLRYRKPSDSDIWWQVNSYIAYGAKGIWYYYFSMDSDQPGDGIFTGIGWYPKHFAEATPDPGFGVHHEDGDDRRYETVRDINRYLHSIWPVLKNLTSVGVFHIDDRPPVGTIGIQSSSPHQLWSLSGNSLLVGVFEDAADTTGSRVYLYIVNKRHGDDSSEAGLDSVAILTLADGYRAHWIGQEGIKPEISEGKTSYGLSLPGGSGVLLRIVSQTDTHKSSRDTDTRE